MHAGEDIKKGELILFITGRLKHLSAKTRSEAMSHPDWIGVTGSSWIDPESPCDFLNHSCDPNAGVLGKVSMYAIRDIKRNDEITVDYSTIEGNRLWEMKCKCNSKKCRGIIKSIHSLPRKTFDEYLPYIPKYFQKMYLRSHKPNHK